MDVYELLKELENEEIISFMETLGAEASDRSNDNHIIFTTICHPSSGKFKLYYYTESKTFHCYSNCGHIGDLIELLVHINQYEKKDAIKEVKEYFNISNAPVLRKGFKTRKKKFKKPTLDDINLELLPISEYKPYVYKTFKQIPILSWEEEFISFETIKTFDIRYDLKNNQIIIPHLCWSTGNVVGVRIRNMDEVKAEKYGKYCPMFYEDHMYNHKLSENLYGLNITKDAINKYKKCCIFEGEKGSLQLYDFYNINSTAVSICGSNMSQFQKKILKDLGVEEVLWCLDKQYENEHEKKLWLDKIIKMSQDFLDYGIRVYAILDEIDGVLDHKDSPVDKGKDVFKILVDNKFKIERE